jgi:4-hydroxy-tetrahydrodipicolinate synthase
MRGLFAAVATPVRPDGSVDEAAFDRVLEFLIAAGVDGVCLGGATSEYPHVDAAARAALIRRASARLPADRALLVGIGAPTVRQTLELGRAAVEAGSAAVLLPMPLFFRYAQDDLREYCAHVSRTLAAPCLLYDLPDFTNPLEPATTLALLREEPFIVGLKDSSGCADRIEGFASARGDRPWTFFVGDDRLLLDGVRAGWNGGISGVAGFCPELLVSLYRSAAAGQTAEAERCQRMLDALIEQMAVFPAPWGVRIGLAARGIDTGPLPLPLTERRRDQVAAFERWFPSWLNQHVLVRRP